MKKEEYNDSACFYKLIGSISLRKCQYTNFQIQYCYKLPNAAVLDVSKDEDEDLLNDT